MVCCITIVHDGGVGVEDVAAVLICHERSSRADNSDRPEICMSEGIKWRPWKKCTFAGLEEVFQPVFQGLSHKMEMGHK
jgi:hypothetical protein